jgi:serine/threonine protein kinase
MPADRERLEQVAAIIVPAEASLAHLGTGGFASTFKVEGDGDPYALKIVDAAQSGSERTDRELAALQRVHHRNVVGYLDTGTVEYAGVTYRWLKMEFIEGRTLADLMEHEGPPNLVTAVGMVRSAVAGAAAMWAEQTAHRDLTPKNLMVAHDGRLVIVDLGLARSLADKTITTLPTPGTPGWMSPEQVGSNPQHGDWRSDQFVLGLIAYWLITGERPFRYNTWYEAWVAPDKQTPRNPRDLKPDVPRALADLVMRMLAKGPHRRYLQASTLEAELERVAASLSVPETTLHVTPQFILSVGNAKSYAAEPGFLIALDPDGIVIEPRGANRVTEFMDLTNGTTMNRMIDPHCYFSRSPVGARKDWFRKLPWGRLPILTGFSTPADRSGYCEHVLDFELASGPTTVIAPYFYAGPSETVWVEESLRCAAAVNDLLAQRAPARNGLLEPVWTTVAVAQTWLSQENARDELMTLLTSQPIQTLQLLVSTTQQNFCPLADLAVLEGLADVLTVMREAGVPVVLGRRSSEGLLGLALGASAWGTGVEGVQQNMRPHPETVDRGGPGYDWIYVPALLTHLTVGSYVLLSSAAGNSLGVDTQQGQTLLASNPTLDPLTTQERLLLLQHNMTAMRDRAGTLAASSGTERLGLMRDWVAQATATFGGLPEPGVGGESATFLNSWARVLA